MEETWTSRGGRAAPAQARAGSRTTARTRSPRARRRAASAPPMNPVAPVTRTRTFALRRRRLVDAVHLGLRAARGLDGAVDEVVVLERPGYLAAGVAERVRAADRLDDEHRVEPAAAPAGLHA